jgi:hypothetical protein
MNKHLSNRTALTVLATSILALSACSSGSDADVATGTLPTDSSVETTVPLVTSGGSSLTTPATLAPITQVPAASQPGQEEATQRRKDGKTIPSDMQFFMPSLEQFAQLIPAAGYFTAASPLEEKEVPAQPSDMPWAHGTEGGWERTWSVQGPKEGESAIVRIRALYYLTVSAAELAVSEMRTSYKAASTTSGVSYKGVLDGKPVTFNSQASVATNSVLVVEITSDAPNAAHLAQAELAAQTIAARINEHFASQSSR